MKRMQINKLYWDFFHDTTAREDFVILQGGKRAGKSVSVLQYIYLLLMSERKKRALIVTDTYARLRDSLLNDFQMISAEHPKASRICWNQTPRIDFYNGNSISFLCAERDSRGFSSDKNVIFFNECIQYDESVVRDAMKAGADDCKVFFDYNPFTRFYVNDRFETPTNKLITTYRDNPFCPRFAREQLDRQAEVGKDAKSGTFERYLYEVECLGVNAELSGLCFPNVETCTEEEYDSIKAVEVLASDWGQVTSSADPDVVCGFKFVGDRIYGREYYYRNDGTDKDIAEVLKSIPFSRQWFVYETATAGKARIEAIYSLCGLRFRFVPCSKGVGSVMIGIRNLQEYKITITEGSRNFLNEQRNYKYITKNDIMKPADRYNHAFDCLRYAYDFFLNNRQKIWK